MTRTLLSSCRELTRGDREMMAATESDLTTGTRLKPSFTDGQQNAQSGSGWPGFQEIIDNGDGVGSSTSMERQPGNNHQDKSYAEPKPHAVGLALQSAGEISSEEAQPSMVSAPVTEPPKGDLCVIRQYIARPTPKKKRVSSHGTKTGCISCGYGKRKSNEKKPSCMQAPLHAEQMYFADR